MPKFNFEPDLHLDSETKKLGYAYRPYLFVSLGYNKRWTEHPVRALLDSGSDNNVFPAQFAVEIRLDYRKGVKHKTTAVNESTSIVYGNNVYLDYGGKVLETVVYFGESVKIPILGRDGFF